MARLKVFVAGVGACVALAGCGAEVGGETATTTATPASAEASGNPWDLPIEQRPPLFDPCAEIPIEAVEEGVGRQVEPNERITRHHPGELMVCGWKNRQVHINLLSTWKSRKQFISDPSFYVRDAEYWLSGRSGMRLVEKGDNSNATCVQIFFTSRGTVWIKLDLVGGLREFRDEKLVQACEALDAAAVPLIGYLPEGDIS